MIYILDGTIFMEIVALIDYQRQKFAHTNTYFHSKEVM